MVQGGGERGREASEDERGHEKGRDGCLGGGKRLSSGSLSLSPPSRPPRALAARPPPRGRPRFCLSDAAAAALTSALDENMRGRASGGNGLWLSRRRGLPCVCMFRHLSALDVSVRQLLQCLARRGMDQVFVAPLSPDIGPPVHRSPGVGQWRGSEAGRHRSAAADDG